MRKWWLSLLGSLFIIPLWAQENLTLTRAWQIARENNLTLQQQATIVRQAEQEVRIRQAGYLPVLSATASYAHISQTATLDFRRLPLPFPAGANPVIEAGANDQYDAALALRQPLFTGWRTGNLVKAAREQQEAEIRQQTILTHRQFLQIGMLYYEIQLNLLSQEVLERGIERAELSLRQTGNLLAARQIAAFDTLEAANQKLRLQNQLSNLRNGEQVLLTRLYHLLNSEARIPVARLQWNESALRLGALDDYLMEASTHRPEIEQIRGLQRASDFQVGALKSAYFPQLFASAAYHYARPGVNFFQDEWMRYYTLGINLQWTLWNGRQDARKVEQGRLASRRLDLQSQQLLLDIRQQVLEAYAMLENAQQQIYLQQRLVHQEAERLRVIRDAFRQGQATGRDVSSAEKTLTAEELSLQEAVIQWYGYKLQLDFATGNIGRPPAE